MFSLPDLPYDYQALEPHIDADTMRLHHDKHHQAYIDKLNTALEVDSRLANLDVYELMGRLNEVPEDKRLAVRNNGGGHANHSFFWQIMGPPQAADGGLSGELAEAINSTFGSLADFKTKFAEAAVGQFGSGWAWLVKSGHKLAITSTSNQDNPWMEGQTPVLGLDVWEHAYYLKYQNRRPDYIEAWWNVVNWPKVSELYKS